MSEKTEKVEKFERFINEKLRSDLAIVLENQARINTEIFEYIQLKETIDKLVLLDLTRFRTRVDLGCNFYAQAQVENESRTVLVAVGLGFFVEMSYDQAVRFVDKKVALLRKESENLSDQAALIKANIKFVLEGLREIQGLKFDDDDKSKNDKSVFN